MTGWIFWIISAIILVILINQNELECKKPYVNSESAKQLIDMIKNTNLSVDNDLSLIKDESLKHLLQNQKVVLDLKLNENTLDVVKINEIINKYY